MKFLDRVKIAISNDALNDHVRRFLRGDDITPGDVAINSENALKYTALFACVRVLAETLASAPICEYRTIDKGDRERTDDTGWYDILHNAPNDQMSAYNFHEMQGVQLNTNGNFYAHKVYNQAGGPLHLVPILGDHVTPRVDRATGTLQYEVQEGDNWSTTKTYTRKRIFHIPGLSTDGLVGVSPITYASSAVRLGLQYESYGINFFKNSALPCGVFSKDGVLDEEAYLRLRETIQKNYQGSQNHGRPMLAEDGLTFTPISVTPMDAQLIENKNFQIEDVSRIYRVPQHMINKLDRATFNNIEHLSLSFLMYTMLPWYKRCEAAINQQLLTKQQRSDGYYFEYNIAGLLRGDLKSMYEAFAIGRQWGWLSVNDIRRMLNMNSVVGGDEYLRPLNMTTIGNDDKLDEQKRAIVNSLRTMVEGGQS